MARNLREHLTYANVVASIALFVALGGASYAAITLPRNSVGAKQIKKNAVNGAKVKNRSLTGADIKISKLPKVPEARLSDHAASADQAGNAATAGQAGALSAPEAWHEVGTPGEPAFKPGSGNHLPQNGFETVAFFKDHEGVVHLKGVADPDPSTSEIFELPAGYRPGRSISLVGVCRTCPAPHVAPVNIFTGGLPSKNGLVFVDPGTPMISLDGLTFRAGS